jgi:hypothetical protein
LWGGGRGNCWVKAGWAQDWPAKAHIIAEHTYVWQSQGSSGPRDRQVWGVGVTNAPGVALDTVAIRQIGWVPNVAATHVKLGCITYNSLLRVGSAVWLESLVASYQKHWPWREWKWRLVIKERRLASTVAAVIERSWWKNKGWVGEKKELKRNL